MLSDEELYAKMKSGDLSAFDRLYERHQRGLFSFIHGYLKSAEESEEVFHEAFMTMLKSPEVDFTQGSFKGWIYLVARNTALNRLRSRERGSNALAQIEDSFEPDIESRILSQGFATRVQEAAARLSEPMAELLRMRLSGLGQKEIAQALRIPVGTVKSRFHALVENLKSELKDYE